MITSPVIVQTVPLIMCLGTRKSKLSVIGAYHSNTYESS